MKNKRHNSHLSDTELNDNSPLPNKIAVSKDELTSNIPAKSNETLKNKKLELDLHEEPETGNDSKEELQENYSSSEPESNQGIITFCTKTPAWGSDQSKLKEIPEKRTEQNTIDSVTGTSKDAVKTMSTTKPQPSIILQPKLATETKREFIPKDCGYCGTEFHNFEKKHSSEDCPHKRCNICFRYAHKHQNGPAFVEKCPDVSMEIEDIFNLPEHLYQKRWRVHYSSRLNRVFYFNPSKNQHFYFEREVRDFERKESWTKHHTIKNG